MIWLKILGIVVVIVGSLYYIAETTPAVTELPPDEKSDYTIETLLAELELQLH